MLNNTKSRTILFTIYELPIAKTSSLLLLLSSPNLNTASTISIVIRGSSNITVVLNISYIPYCFVVKILVYSGTNKKLNILEAKLLNVSKPIFFNK